VVPLEATLHYPVTFVHSNPRAAQILIKPAISLFVDAAFLLQRTELFLTDVILI
jgi:hypothetical protein